jgi:hypothetical protein
MERELGTWSFIGLFSAFLVLLAASDTHRPLALAQNLFTLTQSSFPLWRHLPMSVEDRALTAGAFAAIAILKESGE